MKMKNIKVVLAKDIEGLGKTGEIKAVAQGYARNFLLPRNLAFLANDPRAKALEEKAKKQEEEKISLLDESRVKADEINGKIVNVTVKANKTGKLFAAFTAKDLAKEINLNIPFEIKPLKTAGEHGVTLDFGRGITSHIKVIIEPLKEK